MNQDRADTVLLLPMMFMLNTHGDNHQELHGENAFYDLGKDDDTDRGRFIGKSICCVISYVSDDKPITSPDKQINLSIWIHEDTDIADYFVFRGRHLVDVQIARVDAQEDAALRELFNVNGDFKQFKIIPSG